MQALSTTIDTHISGEKGCSDGYILSNSLLLVPLYHSIPDRPLADTTHILHSEKRSEAPGDTEPQYGERDHNSVAI